MHRWFFVREIHRGEKIMETSAPAAEARACRGRHAPPPPPPSRTAPKSWFAACRPKTSATSGATPAAPSSTSTTRSTSRRRSSTSWFATSRPRCTPPTATRGRPARSASRWSPRGPGVTNAVTGIATAYMDSIPMVIVTGQVPTPAIGLDAFQECDTVGITRPIVKHNFLVKDVRDLALTMKKAFHIARTGRPGPVVVDVPKDVSMTTRAVPLSGERRDALVQPGAEGPRRPDQEGRAAAARRQAALHLHRRRRRPRQRLGRAARAGRPARLPVHQHADGPGRLSRRATRSSSACSACTAPTKRT